MATDTLEGVDAELEKVRGEIAGHYDAMRGLVDDKTDPEGNAGRAEKICRDLDALFTRRGALLRKRAEFPAGVDAAAS